MINKFFGGVFCINLDSRPDRWLECQEEFKKVGLNNVERFPAIFMEPGIAGCSKSHHDCIKLAKERKYDNVLILEDDVSFSENFQDILINVFDQLKNRNISYDMLYLGANLRGNENHLIDKNLAKIVDAKAAHAYIINSSVYDIILDTYININWADLNNWHHHNEKRMNMDVWYRNIQKLGNVYGVYPSLAEQRSGISDLLHKDCYYNLTNVYNQILERTK